MARDEISTYKMSVLSMLINNAEIVEAIDCPNITSPDELIYLRVFPYEYVPEVIDEVATYITMKVDIPRSRRDGNLWNFPLITIWIISHHSHMKTDYGATRIDYIGAIIKQILNGSRDFGSGELLLESDYESSISASHSCRIQLFATKEIKIPVCGG